MSDLAATPMEGMDETVPISDSTDVSSLHVENEGEGVNASPVVQPLYPNLFRIMRIVPDKQDYSFVEKIQLPQDEVMSLCNNLAPSSASAYSGEPPRLLINFNSLNQRCLRVVGFYGDKNMLIQILRNESLVDDSVLAKMEGGLFEAGFYVSLPDKVSCAVVFYWHEGEQLKQASRKDVSCNFIRYLVELCDTVYVCVEGSYPFEALAASAQRGTSKTQRTRKGKISNVKSSEYNVELLPGNSVPIHGGAHGKKFSPEPSENVRIDNNYNGTAPVFCEGYHRCCFLTTGKRDPWKSEKIEEVTVKASEFGMTINMWSSESNVDYSKLSNNQFIDLLQNSRPQEYKQLKESLETGGPAILHTAQFDKFERCFLNVIPEFCPHVLRFVGGESSEEKLEPNSCNDADSLKQLHRELSAILTGKDSVRHGNGMWLLLGSDIKFVSYRHVITVESLGQGNEITPFISYGQEVHAKCSTTCRCSSKIDGKATFEQPPNSTKDFPLSGESVKIVISPDKLFSKSKEIEGEVRLESFSNSAIRCWVENMVPIELRSLEENVVFTSFLLGHDQSLAEAFIQNHLRSQNMPILPLNQSLAQTSFQDLFEKFSSVQSTQPTYDQLGALLCNDTLKTMCCKVYKDQECKFRDNIKKLWTRLLRNGGCLASRQLGEVEDKFVQEFKKKMLVFKEDNLVTRFITEVTVENQKSTSFWSWPARSQADQQVELKLKLSKVEEHPFSIVYKACELTPMKKDIDEANANSGHPIVPTCGESVELAAINPQSERLYKVVVLKSGERIIFIHNFKKSSLYLHRCPKLGVNISNMEHPRIREFKRGFDLVAVDEATRSIALYDKEKSKIAIYRFDESFKKVYWSGVEFSLEIFIGSKNIVWMHLIPGRMELLLVDDTNRVRVVEIHREPSMRAKYISLHSQKHPLRACISVDGYFFLVFRQLQSESEANNASPGNVIDAYVLGDIMSFLKTIPLNITQCSISDIEQFGAKFMIFGSQTQLLLYSPADAPGTIFLHVLKCSLAKETMQVQQIGQIKDPEDETEFAGSCPYLGYIFHIFDKFATAPKLFPDAERRVTFNVVMKSINSDGCSSEACLKYLKALIKELKVRKEKVFSSMEILFEVNSIENCPISTTTGEQALVKMGRWVRKLLCLVPIQIARAESNAMVALKDGLQIPADVNYRNSVSLANSIRFGFYDAVLSSWKDKIKVISSMGKQSSGKSYLLNHLSGSLLDVAGGRCTDGVWMTIVTGEDGDDRCLYVLLDFEGLGSFERSEQEDVLLSVFNAAVSNITIFNKKDFHLDKDTESAFNRFQSGINLLKQDDKLFKGLFYIAIKDVDKSDVEELIDEFYEKISQICTKSPDNFISKMYDGRFEIAAMAPYNRSEYYTKSLSELARTVATDITSCYDNGFTFLRDLKLIIAQIASKDWSSIDDKRVAVIVDILRRNLLSAVQMAYLSVTNKNEELRVLDNFDTQEEVPDFPVVVGDISWNIKDSGLFLIPSTGSSAPVTMRDVLSQVRSKLEVVLPRNGRSGEEWHSLFQKFLEALADRRRERVQQWISSNSTDFCESDEVKRLKLEANGLLGQVKQGLSVCAYKCSDCFWRCVMEKGHADQHSCMGSHKCTENCTYCAREGDILTSCGDLAGHEGAHDCKEKNHTCSDKCYLYEISLHCNEVCSLRVGHHGQHKCNSPQHTCREKCSLPSCTNLCAVVIESSHDHKHQCHERYCQRECMIKGCTRRCGVEDHFHDLEPNAEHFCGNEHVCPEECEKRGICEIFTELVKQNRIFQGQRGSFEYEVVSEQNGLRKGCCIPIPPNKGNHEGPHVHTSKEDPVHYCDTRCQSCGYFCQRPIDHSGLHDTIHGNMRKVRFISEGEDIDIQDRKYKWGEKGVAEMCNMYCKKQGRGHIHLVTCPASNKCTGNLYDGARHETLKYGPDVDTPKDEMTHETYWKYVRFADPCTEEERKEFDRCNHYCKSEEHNTGSGPPAKSYCTEKLWHQPIKRIGQNGNSKGFISKDGHLFPCDHSKNVPHHIIFIVDRSGSMSSRDRCPTESMFDQHKNRLGCVYEAILKFIRVRLRTVCDDSVSVVLFDGSANVAVEMEDMNDGVVGRLLSYRPGGITNFSAGLDAAEKILGKGSQDPSMKVKKPVAILLSDGENNSGGDPLDGVDKMKRAEPRMVLHTILFSTRPATYILNDMAKKGGGECKNVIDELELARAFENLANSLKPQVAALM